MTDDQVQFIRRYIDALRSGSYTQIRGVLREHKPEVGNCFCALGVIADLKAHDNPECWAWQKKKRSCFYTLKVVGGERETSVYLPIEIAEEVGLSNLGFNQFTIQSWNDNLKYSFD